MKRPPIYDVPHKALRNIMSQMSLLAGKTHFANAAEVEKLYHLGAQMFSMLTTHAHDEDRVTLAELEQRLPGASKDDTDDHKEIHEAQQKLEKLLTKIFTESKAGKDVSELGQEFYLNFNEFFGHYLLHTAQEERVTQPLLWKHFTNGELAGHRDKIMANIPPDTLLMSFKFSVPAQSHHERVMFLTGFKKVAPEQFFNKSMDVIKGVLSSEEFIALSTALN